MPVRRALDWDSVRAAPAVGRLGLEIDRPGSPATEPPSAGLPRRSSAGGLVLTGSHPETYCTVHAAPAESKVRVMPGENLEGRSGQQDQRAVRVEQAEGRTLNSEEV